MQSYWRHLKNETRGGAVVEFVLVTPLLLLLTMGAIDFGRAFYQSVTISHAAETGAFYGAQSSIYSSHNAEMTQRAKDDAVDVGTVTVTSGRVCKCPDGTVVDCVSGTCAGYGAPRVYVSCDVQKSFNVLTNFPKVPDLFTVRRKVYVRVQ